MRVTLPAPTPLLNRRRTPRSIPTLRRPAAAPVSPHIRAPIRAGTIPLLAVPLRRPRGIGGRVVTRRAIVRKSRVGGRLIADGMRGKVRRCRVNSTALGNVPWQGPGRRSHQHAFRLRAAQVAPPLPRSVQRIPLPKRLDVPRPISLRARALGPLGLPCASRGLLPPLRRPPWKHDFLRGHAAASTDPARRCSRAKPVLATVRRVVVGSSWAAWRRGGRQHLEGGRGDATATALLAQRHVVVEGMRREGPRTGVGKPHEQVAIAPHAEERLRLLRRRCRRPRRGCRWQANELRRQRRPRSRHVCIRACCRRRRLLADPAPASRKSHRQSSSRSGGIRGAARSHVARRLLHHQGRLEYWHAPRCDGDPARGL